MRESIDYLIERSSLGSPLVKQIAQRTPVEVADRIIFRATGSGRSDISVASEGNLLIPAYRGSSKPTTSKEASMGFTARFLDEILRPIQAEQAILNEARDRRASVLAIALKFVGALRVFNSGSLAHGTVIKPVSDADCGVVLDRRSYPELGPDGGEVGPDSIVEEVRDFIGAELRETYKNARLTITKRAIKVTFDEPLNDEEDPSVDIVVGLTRASAEGLWIPNTEKDEWDPSHPEKHTELLTGGSKALRRIRARAIRLSKAWNKQYSKPAVCSFNLEALALTAIENDTSLPEALHAFFDEGATQLAKGLTPDPAGVSDPIKVPDLPVAIRRFEAAEQALNEALKRDDDEDAVREALSVVFHKYISPPKGASKSAWADAVRKMEQGTIRIGATGLTLGSDTGGRVMKPVRSFGDDGR